MTVSENHRKMRGSNIPRPAQQTSLAKEKFAALRAIIDGKEYRTELGLTCYVLHADGRTRRDRPVLAAALMAKELALTGNRVYYSSLAGLLRELDKLDYGAGDVEVLNEVLSVHRNGYIVIPDFDNFSAIPEQHDWLDALDFLTVHVNAGGGLVLGQWAPTPDVHAVYGSAFAMVYGGFTALEVA